MSMQVAVTSLHYSIVAHAQAVNCQHIFLTSPSKSMVAHAQAAYKTGSRHGLCSSEMEESELECYTCVLCKEYLVETPRQAPCGERLCSPCWREQQSRCSEDIVTFSATARS